MRSVIIILALAFLVILFNSIYLASEGTDDDIGIKKSNRDDIDINAPDEYPPELRAGLQAECAKISEEIKKLALTDLSDDSEDIRYVLIRFYVDEFGKASDIEVKSYVDQTFLDKIKAMIEKVEFTTRPKQGKVAVQFKVGF